MLSFIENNLNTWDLLGLLSSEECLALRAKMIRNTFEVIKMLARYKPVRDWEGGDPIAPWKGGGVTKGGGTHYQNIKRHLKSIRDDYVKYKTECMKKPPNCPPPPKYVPKTLRRTIPKPVPATPVSPRIPAPTAPDWGVWARVGYVTLATGIVVGTIGADFLSGGASLADDPISFSTAAGLVIKAFTSGGVTAAVPAVP